MLINAQLFQIEEVETAIRAINSVAEMKRCLFSKVDINWVLDIGSFSSPQNILLRQEITAKGVSGPTSLDICRPIDFAKKARTMLPAASGHRLNPLGTYGFSFPGHVVIRDIEKMLDSILYNNGIDKKEDGSDATDNAMKIYRIKGVLHAADDSSHLYLFQGVHEIFEITESSIVAGSADDTTGGLNKVIVIGKNLDMLIVEERFIDCMK